MSSIAEVRTILHQRSSGEIELFFIKVDIEITDETIWRVSAAKSERSSEYVEQDFDEADEAYTTYVQMVRESGNSEYIPPLHELAPETLPKGKMPAQDEVTRIILKYMVKLTAVDHQGRMQSNAVQEMLADPDFARHAPEILAEMDGKSTAVAAAIRVGCKRILRQAEQEALLQQRQMVETDPDYGRF